MLTRPRRRRRKPDKNYRISHPWDSIRTRWLWLIGVATYWPAAMAALVIVVIGLVNQSQTVMAFALPAMLLFAVGLILEGRGWRPVATIARVGIPPWPIIVAGHAGQTALIVGALELVARLPVTITDTPADGYMPAGFWSAVISTSVYPILMALSVTDAIRTLVDGRWQFSAIYLGQMSAYAAMERLHPDLVELERIWYLAAAGGVLSGLLRWMLRSQARPVRAAITTTDGGWRVRGFWFPRRVSVTADDLTPAIRQKVESAISAYRRLPPDWPEVAGREQTARIADLARHISRRQPRRRILAKLDDWTAELDQLADATGRPTAAAEGVDSR